MEKLTDELEAEAGEYFAKIAELGGMIAAIEAGFFRNQIAGASYRLARQIETGQRQIVGVNAFAEAGEPIPLHVINPRTEARQVAGLTELKGRRNAKAVAESLDRLKAVAAAGGSTIEPMIAAAEAYATVGEMVAALKQVYGPYNGPRDW